MTSSPSNRHSEDHPTAPSQVLGWALVVLSTLQLMVVLDGTVVNLALARIQEDLGLSDALRNWIVTGYSLAYGGLLLLGGRIGDVCGRKRTFLVGVSLFTAASLVCGLASSAGILLLARVVQGMGAAVASPTAMALIVVMFRPGKPRNQAFSIFAMMSGLGSVSGLVIGGILTEASWRWIFLVNVPMGILIVIAGLRSLNDRTPGEGIGLDITGAVLATGGSTLLVFAMMNQGASAAVAAFIAIILLVWFFRSQTRVAYPVLPLSIFTSHARRAVFMCILLVGALMMAVTVQVALFVQTILGYTPLQAGLGFLPFAVALGVGSAVAGKLAENVPPRTLIVSGGAILALGFIYSSTLTPETQYLGGLLPPILIIGVGTGAVLIPLTLSVVAGVTPDQVGPLTATSLVSQTIGGPLGLAAASGVGSLVADPARGYTTSLWVCAAFSLAIILIAATRITFSVSDIAEGKQAEQASQNS